MEFVKRVTKLPQAKPGGPGIPLDTVKRLSLYLRILERLKERGTYITSSEAVVRHLNFSPAQFRKDLSYFGKFGKNGVGYNVDALASGIKKILGTDRPWNVAIVGTGKMGTALLTYPGFRDFNFNICAAFDSDPDKIGRTLGAVTVKHVNELKSVLKALEIQVAILTVTRGSAQAMADTLAKTGIKAILNFTPTNLLLPRDIHVSNLDIACELETLAYRLNYDNPAGESNTE